MLVGNADIPKPNQYQEGDIYEYREEKEGLTNALADHL